MLCTVEFTKKSEITPIELDYAHKFIRTSEDYLSETGRHLKTRIHCIVSFTSYVSNVKVAITSKCGYALGVDSFLSSFIEHYKSNEEFHGSLLVCLMKAYVSKVDGVDNSKYGTKVLNIYLALAASIDKKAFKYVSGNLVGVALQQMQCIISELRIAPFISLDEKKWYFTCNL